MAALKRNWFVVGSVVKCKGSLGFGHRWLTRVANKYRNGLRNSETMSCFECHHEFFYCEYEYCFALGNSLMHPYLLTAARNTGRWRLRFQDLNRPLITHENEYINPEFTAKLVRQMKHNSTAVGDVQADTWLEAKPFLVDNNNLQCKRHNFGGCCN